MKDMSYTQQPNVGHVGAELQLAFPDGLDGAPQQAGEELHQPTDMLTVQHAGHEAVQATYASRWRRGIAAGVAVVAGVGVASPSYANEAPQKASTSVADVSDSAAMLFSTECVPDPDPVTDSAAVINARNDCVVAYENIDTARSATAFAPDILHNDTDALDPYGVDMQVVAVNENAPQADVSVAADGYGTFVTLEPGATGEFSYEYTLASRTDPTQTDTATVKVVLADVVPVVVRKLLNKYHKPNGKYSVKNKNDDYMTFYSQGTMKMLKPFQRIVMRAHHRKVRYSAYLNTQYMAYAGSGVKKFSARSIQR